MVWPDSTSSAGDPGCRRRSRSILALSLEHPTYGAQRLANEPRLRGVDVSPSGVRGVWLRHDLEARYKRLMRLETQAQDETIILTDEQVRLLERHSCEFRMRHVEANAPGELLNQDTFYWGTLKGVGKVYVQVVVDVSAPSPSPRSTPPRCRSLRRTC